MPRLLVIVENRDDWKSTYPQVSVVTAWEYLAQGTEPQSQPTQVINLCRSYKYLSMGYYCSLLAEARGQMVTPALRTIQDLSRRALYGLEANELGKRIQRSLREFGKHASATSFELLIFFGQCPDHPLEDVARQIYELFPAPLLRVRFELNRHWHLSSIEALPIHQLETDFEDRFGTAFAHIVDEAGRWVDRRVSGKPRLAILHNPEEKQPPSNREALATFLRIADELGMYAELIEKKDFARLPEFDGLFIRETTSVDDQTYQFAIRAAAAGQVVIDDPDSMLKCANKVYLAELLQTHGVPTPKTVILARDGIAALASQIPFPIVLKIPDSSFSRGVHKVENQEELEKTAAELFEHSDLIVAQEFVYTPFDWRVGVLDRTPLFVSRYVMPHGYWKVWRYEDGDAAEEGATESVPVDAAPPEVVRTALKAANLIGAGLYGVDLKETDRGVMVIEVNENPNLDRGFEDQALGDTLYRRVLSYFRARMRNSENGLRATDQRNLQKAG